MLFLWDGVEAAAVERMTAKDSAHGQPRAFACAVTPDGLLRVDAAAGQEPAEAADEGRQRHAIYLNEQQEAPGGRAGTPLGRRAAGGGLGTHARPRVVCTRESRAWESAPGRNRAASSGAGSSPGGRAWRGSG